MLHFDDFATKAFGNLSITFILDIPTPILIDLFKDTRFSGPPAVQTQRVTQDLFIGPPEMPIAIFKQTRISYIGDRYRLQIVGPISDLVELKDMIQGLFERGKFSLQNLTRYCEFTIPFTAFELRDTITKIKSKTNIDDIEVLNEVCGCELKPFRLSLSNLDSPLSDEWFHISLQPDVNRTHDVLLVEIIKRTRGFDDMKDFLANLTNIVQNIDEWLSRD